MKRNELDVSQFVKECDDKKKEIKRAFDHAATLIKEEAQRQFKSSINIYKNATSKYNKLVDGIIRGKMKDNNDRLSINVSAMKNKFFYDSYLTQFFVGGTIGRYKKRTKQYTGRIKANEAIDRAAKRSIIENALKHILMENALKHILMENALKHILMENALKHILMENALKHILMENALKRSEPRLV